MRLFDRLRRTSRSRKATGDLACQELVELITEYLEGALPDRDRIRLEAHISKCADCRTYLEQMRQTIEVLGRLSERDVTSGVLDELLVAFQAWKEG
jgi:anti-sigma factor RsiW